MTPTILIVGSTGSVGSELSRQLTAKGVPFKALVRTPPTKQTIIPSTPPTTQTTIPTSSTIAIGDLHDPTTISRILEGIEKVFLLTNSSEQAQTLQSDFVDLATDAGVKHIVKLSQFAADPDSPVRFLRYHAVVEQKIKDSGLTYTFLRPNLYMQGLLGFSDFISKHGTLIAPIDTATVSAVDIRDIAAVAAEALTQKGHENKIYDLTGPEVLTHREIAAHLSKAIGKPIQFIPVSAEEMLPGLLAAGFPAWQAEGLLEDYAHYSRGEASIISSAITDITGKPARDFATFSRDYSSAFSG